MDYSNKLKDSRWIEKRERILLRDGFLCVLCNKTSPSFDVHHLFYLPNREPWEYDDDALVTLCRDCHNHVHEQYPKILGLLSFQVIKNKKTFFDLQQLINLV